MLNVKQIALVYILLLLGLTFMISVAKLTEAQQEHLISITGYTWDHSTITVCVIPRDNESWWQPAYLDAVLNGIAHWNDAIQKFASANTEFLFLSSVHLVPTVTYENVTSFDVYIGWIGECESETTIGQTHATIKSLCTILNSTVCLAAKAPSGHVMTGVDMQNIVTHELGHTFGLSHCSYSEDVMYSTISYSETVKQLSSLDLYALSQVFGWMTNSIQFEYSNMCPEESSITLPQNISYAYYPIAAEHLPTGTQNLIEYIAGQFQRPELLIVILALVMLLVIFLVKFYKK